MPDTTVTGPLVIADISGYTAFIADTELEHSREILTELLETVVSSMGGHLTVAQLEGDAVCFVGTETRPEVLDWMEQCFIGFHRRLRDIRTSSTCECRACSTVGSLTMKLVGHHGSYSWHRVGKIEQLVGTPVNAVHRLLKNTIPSHEYIFLSQPLLDLVPARRRDAFVAHIETYDHVGAIPGAFEDLAPLRAIASQPERGPVTAEEAKLSSTYLIDGTVDDAWWLISDPTARAGWLHQPHVDYKGGARGHMLGAEYHCHHGKNKTTVFRVIDAQEPSLMTIRSTVAAGVVMYDTETIAPEGDRVRIDMVFTWGGGGGLKGIIAEKVTGMVMRKEVAAWGPRMQDLVRERRERRTVAEVAAAS
ncbi:MAG: DUF2652 domain-containing protein [Chloroflexi bacterium]|nr:DUF2652 domain-containing protein [Chloroflexota bacterium]